MRLYFRDLGVDSRQAIRAFAQNRSALVIANLLLLPWFLTILFAGNTGAWQPLAEIFGIMLAYWFFTRRRDMEMLEVRQPIIETALALMLVLIWMLFRIGQYTHIYTLPTLHVYALTDIYETIVPKMIEMFFVPLAIWLALRYPLRALGIRLSWRDWIPALVPIGVLAWIGLHNNEPREWFAALIYFFFGAGLPEEFLFRGILQPRLEALLKSPLWGLYLASLVFGVSHLPIDLSTTTPNNWITAFESAFTFQLSVGFALGYCFQRVRNILPLAIIHTLIDAAP